MAAIATCYNIFSCQQQLKCGEDRLLIMAEPVKVARTGSYMLLRPFVGLITLKMDQEGHVRW